MDKVFVSVDRLAPEPVWYNPEFGGSRPNHTGPGPRVTISWPPSGTRATVVRDQLDAPDDDDGKRVAIHGTVSARRRARGSMCTSAPTRGMSRSRPSQRKGFLGVRVRLSGQGRPNRHSILVRLCSADDQELASDQVQDVIRIDPFVPGAGAIDAGGAPVRQSPVRRWEPIVVEAKDFTHSGTHREVGRCANHWRRARGAARQWRNGVLSCAVARGHLRNQASHFRPARNRIATGEGVHSPRDGGAVAVMVNDILVRRIVCRHQGMYNDFWPERRPELVRTLPDVDLAAKVMMGRVLTIKFVASPWACMDLRSIEVAPVP